MGTVGTGVVVKRGPPPSPPPESGGGLGRGTRYERRLLRAPGGPAGVGGLAIVGLSGGCFDLDLWDTNSRDLRIQHKWIQVGSIRPDNRSRLWIHADLHEECTLL